MSLIPRVKKAVSWILCASKRFHYSSCLGQIARCTARQESCLDSRICVLVFVLCPHPRSRRQRCKQRWIPLFAVAQSNHNLITVQWVYDKFFDAQKHAFNGNLSGEYMHHFESSSSWFYWQECKISRAFEHCRQPSCIVEFTHSLDWHILCGVTLNFIFLLRQSNLL